jgi:hypothetical protein
MVVERAEGSDLPTEQEPSLSVLVSGNPKTNRTLFWRDVEDERRHRGNDRQLTCYWQVHFVQPTLWRLSVPDLQWLYNDLTQRRREGDRRIVLSAIVSILENEGQLKDEVATLRARIGPDKVLDADLTACLTPPEEDEETRMRRARLEEAKRERAEKKEHDKESWKDLRRELQGDPRQVADPEHPSFDVRSLWDLTRWLERRTEKNASDAVLQWRQLYTGFGAQVAEAYQEGMRSLWRRTQPERPTRKGSKTTVKYVTVLSFAAIALEAAEDPAWASRLLPAEALRAAQHGCMAEQGYPAWIEALVQEHFDVVSPVIRAAIKGEWSSRSPGGPDFLAHYGFRTRLVMPLIENSVYDIFTRTEPKSLNTFDYGLRVLQQMDLDGERQKSLTKLAMRRFKRKLSAQNHDRALRYVALLFRVDVPRAVEVLANWLRNTKARDRKVLAEKVFGMLFGHHSPLAASSLVGGPVSSIKRLVLLAYEHVRPEDDNVHEGSFSPDARDDAESGRNRVLKALLDSSGADAYTAVLELADRPEARTRGHRLRELARGMAERDTEISPWTVADVLTMERRYTAPVKTGPDLFRMVLFRLDDINFSFAHADASSRRVLEVAPDEKAVQTWLAEQLNLRANGCYHAHREVEVAGGKEPDVIVSSTSASCHVAIEVKHGRMKWTVRQLEKALQKQLADDYLKPESRRHGVFVVTHHGTRTWLHPETRKVLIFPELIAYLADFASTLRSNTCGPIEVAVRGIDASPATSRSSRTADASNR